MATIRIKDLSLRTIIGIYDWERKKKQDVVINLTVDFDGSKASRSDKIEDTVDYKTLTKKIITEVEQSQYYLVERLAGRILEISLEDPKVESATVEVDKPMALRFSKSVSVEMKAERT